MGLQLCEFVDPTETLLDRCGIHPIRAAVAA
jgi:hypothetical protein